MTGNLIFVHGFASSRLIWRNQVDAMERLGWKSHAVDLLGHGEGKRPASVNEFNISSMYQVFLEEINKYNSSEPLVFVGHSLGCYLSILHALEFPTQSRGLVLIAPLLNTRQFIARTSVGLQSPRLGSLFLKLTPLGLVRSIIRYDTINSSGLPDDLINQVALDYKRADPRIVYIGRSLVDLDGRVGNLQCPVALLWGKKDNTLSPASFESLGKTINPLNTCAISDGGHSIHLTHSGVVNQTMEEFLRKIA